MPGRDVSYLNPDPSAASFRAVVSEQRCEHRHARAERERHIGPKSRGALAPGPTAADRAACRQYRKQSDDRRSEVEIMQSLAIAVRKNVLSCENDSRYRMKTFSASLACRVP